jgi:hypothetical protein
LCRRAFTAPFLENNYSFFYSPVFFGFFVCVCIGAVSALLGFRNALARGFLFDESKPKNAIKKNQVKQIKKPKTYK